jgi:hypothetical protein
VINGELSVFFSGMESVSYSIAKLCQISSGGGEGVLMASSNDFSGMTMFQSVGLLVGDKVPSVITSANSSFTMVRMVQAAAVVDMSICFSWVFV